MAGAGSWSSESCFKFHGTLSYRGGSVQPASGDVPMVRLASGVVRDQVMAAVIDRSQPSGRITGEKWEMVEAKVMERLMDFSDGDQPMPSFEIAGWQFGVKLIGCKDEYSFEWCKGSVRSLGAVWEGARLDLVRKSPLNRRSGARGIQMQTP